MAWTMAQAPRQAGRLAVVTGATGGLGFETALALAQAGAEVVMAARDANKAAAALARLQGLIPRDAVRFEPLDLADLASVRGFAARMAADDRPIDFLVNNAGVMGPPARQTTKDGFEAQLGVNHLGHFALTGLLLPSLRRASSPRVVTVSSLAARMGAMDFDNLQWATRYSAWAAYARSKLANLLFMRELQRRSDAGGWGLTSTAAHPGWARTELTQPRAGGRANPLFKLMDVVAPVLGQSAADGALPTLYAATALDARAGGVYGPDGLGAFKGAPTLVKGPAAADSQADARRLWEVSKALTGVRY